MKARTWLFVIVGALLIGSVAYLVVSGLVVGYRQQQAAFAVFTGYTNALVAHDYARAYSYCGDEFRKATPFEAFVAMQRAVESDLGPLQSVRQGNSDVRQRGASTSWTATIAAEYVYQKGSKGMITELHYHQGRWKVFGFTDR